MSAGNESFEASLRKLEEIVRKLEGGELGLEESLKLYEEGTRLSRECIDRLDQAEQRIEMLGKDEEGKPVLKDIGGTSGQATGRVGRSGSLGEAD